MDPRTRLPHDISWSAPGRPSGGIMRVADVCSELGTTNPVSPSRGISHGIARAFGNPTRVRGTGYALAKGANSSPHRLPPATIVLMCLLILSALQGCARL